MNIRSFILTEHHRLEPIPSEDLSSELLKDEVLRWIDVEAPKVEVFSEYFVRLGIPQTVIESCLKPSNEPDLARYENMIYIEFPVILEEHEFRRTYVSIIYLPSTLITVHKERILSVSGLETRLSLESIFHSSSISGLLYELIFYLFKRNYLFFQDVRNQINKLAKSLEENPESVMLADILSLRSLLNSFITLIEDQNYCVEILLASESKSDGLGVQRKYLKDLRRSVQNGLRVLNRYDSRMSDLHQHYMLTLQNKTNNRLRVLTIFSAIFLPLTLIAGIYGMNFQHMPELDDHHAYFVVLGFMIFIALTMLFFFYLRGWFK